MTREQEAVVDQLACSAVVKPPSFVLAFVPFDSVLIVYGHRSLLGPWRDVAGQVNAWDEIVRSVGSSGHPHFLKRVNVSCRIVGLAKDLAPRSLFGLVGAAGGRGQRVSISQYPGMRRVQTVWAVTAPLP